MCVVFAELILFEHKIDQDHSPELDVLRSFDDRRRRGGLDHANQCGDRQCGPDVIQWLKATLSVLVITNAADATVFANNCVDVRAEHKLSSTGRSGIVKFLSNLPETQPRVKKAPSTFGFEAGQLPSYFQQHFRD